MADAGTDAAAVTVRLSRSAPAEIVSLNARRGAEAALAERARQALGADLPGGPKRIALGGISILGVAPRRWLVLREGRDAGFEPALSAQFEGLAAVCLQSDAYGRFNVTGARARDVLAKGVPVDIHPAAFGPADVAVTTCAHMGIILWRPGGDTTFELAVGRSYEDHFWAWLCESAAEFGVD